MRQLHVIVVSGFLATALCGCEEEPWDPFGLKDMTTLPANDPSVEERPRQCNAQFFYNGPNGQLVLLGCEKPIDHAVGDEAQRGKAA